MCRLVCTFLVSIQQNSFFKTRPISTRVHSMQTFSQFVLRSHLFTTPLSLHIYSAYCLSLLLAYNKIISHDLVNIIFTFFFLWSLTSQSTIFQLCRDGSSWVEPVLSKDKCVLLKDTTQWRLWGLNLRPLSLKSSTLPLSHCAPTCISKVGQMSRSYIFIYLKSSFHHKVYTYEISKAMAQ